MIKTLWEPYLPPEFWILTHEIVNRILLTIFYPFEVLMQKGIQIDIHVPRLS